MKDNGLVHVPSAHSVADTVARFDEILKAKGIQLFAHIDHSGEAQKAGLQMPPTQLLIFGSPKSGTPLMQAAPTLAIDLPLKALVWHDDKGKVWITYNAPEYLQQRHDVPPALIANIAGIAALVKQAAE